MDHTKSHAPFQVSKNVRTSSGALKTGSNKIVNSYVCMLISSLQLGNCKQRNRKVEKGNRNRKPEIQKLEMVASIIFTFYARVMH